MEVSMMEKRLTTKQTSHRFLKTFAIISI
jgi:hypothetical protein